MEIRGSFVNTSFKFTDAYPEILNNFVEDNELYNNPNLLFLEDNYIEECTRFSKIVDKYKIKQFGEQISIYIDNELRILGDYSKEVELFNLIIMDNNINGLQKKDLSVSINHFEIYAKSDKIKFIQSLYILLFLSNITEFRNNTFLFKVRFDDRETIEQINFDEVVVFTLFDIYSWIICSKENIHTRLKIIREIIIRKQSFKLSEDDINSAKSAFNRIIREETDKYFTQVNMLKDDFLILSEHKRENYASLHLKFLTWGSSIAIFIYSEIKDSQTDNLFQKLLLSRTDKSLIFLTIFTISLIIIWLLFIKEVSESKKEYLKLKEFYTKQLFFEEDDFTNFICAPKIPCHYTLVFTSILLALFIRLVVFF